MTGTSILAGSGELSKGLSIWYPYVMPSGTVRAAVESPRIRALKGMERLRRGDARGVCALLEAAGDFPGLMGLAVGEIGLWLSGRGRRHATQDLLSELRHLRDLYRTAAAERATPPERAKFAPPALDEGVMERLREAVEACGGEVRAAWIGRRLCRDMPSWRQIDIILEARSEVWLEGNARLRRLLEEVSGRLRAVFDGDASLLVGVAPYGVRPRVLAAMRREGEPLLDPVERPAAARAPARSRPAAMDRLKALMGMTDGGPGHTGEASEGAGGALARRFRALRGRVGRAYARLAGAVHGLATSMTERFAVRRLVMGTMVFSLGLPLLLAWKVFVDNSDTHARIGMLETLRQERLRNSYWRDPGKLADAEPEKVAEAYLAAMRAHDASPLLPLYSGATREMLRKRRLTPVDMDAQVARHEGCGPLKALVNGGNALVRHEGEGCPPFLLKKEGGQWRVDLTVDPSLRTLVAETLPLLRGGLGDEKLGGADAREDRLDIRS